MQSDKKHVNTNDYREQPTASNLGQETVVRTRSGHVSRKPETLPSRIDQVMTVGVLFL